MISSFLLTYVFEKIFYLVRFRLYIQINVLSGKRGGSVNYLNIVRGPRGRVNELIFLARLRTYMVKGKKNEGKNGK